VFEDKFCEQQNPSQFLERRIATLYGATSLAIKALDLVIQEMCKAKGFKRDNGTDYYNHCVDVATTIISFGVKDEDVVCAALLHDIIEDVSGYTQETIKNMFNPNVARLVMLVTKKEGVDYKKPENLEAYITTISMDINASVIKTADRMHNMMTLDEKTFEARYKKAIETEKYYLPFFKLCRYMYPRYENLFYSARAQIEPLIYHIKSFYLEQVRLAEECEQWKAKVIQLQQKNDDYSGKQN